MVKMYIRHTVADFAKWKAAYEKHDATRQKFGAKKSEAFANTKNPNEFLVVTVWDNREQAKSFLEKSDIKEVMEQAGVIGAPEISFGE